MSSKEFEAVDEKGNRRVWQISGAYPRYRADDFDCWHTANMSISDARAIARCIDEIDGNVSVSREQKDRISELERENKDLKETLSEKDWSQVGDRLKSEHEARELCIENMKAQLTRDTEWRAHVKAVESTNERQSKALETIAEKFPLKRELAAMLLEITGTWTSAPKAADELLAELAKDGGGK